MMEKIIHMTLLFLGAVTFSTLIIFTITSIAEKIQRKIERSKDPRLNVKRINRLLRKVQREGREVVAKGASVEVVESRSRRYLELYSVFEITLDEEIQP